MTTSLFCTPRHLCTALQKQQASCARMLSIQEHHKCSHTWTQPHHTAHVQGENRGVWAPSAECAAAAGTALPEVHIHRVSHRHATWCPHKSDAVTPVWLLAMPHTGVATQMPPASGRCSSCRPFTSATTACLPPTVDCCGVLLLRPTAGCCTWLQGPTSSAAGSRLVPYTVCGCCSVMHCIRPPDHCTAHVQTHDM